MIRGQPHGVPALTASVCFHGLLAAALIGLGCGYHPRVFVVPQGSAFGGPVIVLQSIVIAVPPVPIAHPLPPAATVPVTVAEVTARVASPQPPRPMESKPQPSEAGVPVLALHAARTSADPTVRTETAVPKVARSETTGSASGQLHPSPAKTVSSFAPGTSFFPHPPYPPEAHDLQETGTVQMMVRFDANGDVADAEIAQSSGVAVLDSETQAYIRARWHSSAYAGMTVTVPVEYTLTSL